MNRYRAQYFINEDEHTQYIDAESENIAMDRIPDKADRIRIIQMSVEEISTTSSGASKAHTSARRRR